MKVPKKLVLFTSVLVVTTMAACSVSMSQSQSPNQNQAASTHPNPAESRLSANGTKHAPAIAYLSVYRTGSKKPQPELFLVHSDERILKHVNDWKESSIPAVLPSAGTIDRIYVFQYAYEMNGTSTAEYYMYIIDSEGNDYIKEFKYSEAFQNTTDKERIVEEIGSDNWFKVAERSKLLEP
ncbi:hypothetical protein [Paenibacillus sp. YPG26]|uniref:hypothetical protein n=1 Tax=Paenibacillus sp. YPG26 TaxID=2878915 RepID=UPI00203EFE2E|nr:hypothetical protein [Paenibacillus sp. YPG26]USB33762.1 hypothetical protein LDO05_02755 [Paenibacillus sp. YPG26]